MSEARIDRISNENNTGGPTLSGITTFSGQNYFVPPRGTTAERPSDCPPGSIRFNTDGAHLEYFDGLQWLELEAFNVELGVNGALGNRGLFGGGYAPGDQNTIDYITISTLGNAQDFGDLTIKRRATAAVSDRTRGVWIGGRQSNPAPIGLGAGNTIDYVTMSSTGDSIDFGDTFQFSQFGSGLSNSTRGIFINGSSRQPFVPATDGATNIINYITIQSTGNSVDFGDLSSTFQHGAGCSSSTRGVFAGGYVPGTPASTFVNVMEFVTISTLGNTVDFGDLTQARFGQGGCSNATRGIFSGGGTPTSVNTIDFITITSTGNAQDFGDRTVSSRTSSATSSPTRGIFVGGYIINVIDYAEISTTGNAQDFGDLTQSRMETQSCSNGHGGL